MANLYKIIAIALFIGINGSMVAAEADVETMATEPVKATKGTAAQTSMQRPYRSMREYRGYHNRGYHRGYHYRGYQTGRWTHIRV